MARKSVRMTTLEGRKGKPKLTWDVTRIYTNLLIKTIDNNLSNLNPI